MVTPALGEVSWERMARAVERVRERLLRATSTLDQAYHPEFWGWTDRLAASLAERLRRLLEEPEG